MPVAEMEQFRHEVRAWLEAHAPKRGGPDDFSSAHVEHAKTLGEYEATLAVTMRRVTAWQRSLDDRGWGALGWPERFGGLGAAHRKVFVEEQAQVGVTTKPLSVGIEMVGPTLIAHGAPEQQERYLPPMRRGDEVWCQLFSEPGAGSDLPSLRTAADEVEGGWIVNGQKVWTSGASVSDFGLALVRTDPSQPRHAGISALIVDMAAPGVEVRPLRQISGAFHFNEVFLTDVFVSTSSLVGSLGTGWQVASTMLASERTALGGGTSSGTPEELVALVRTAGRSGDAVVRGALADLTGRAKVLQWLVQRAQSQPDAAAVVKLAYSDHARRMTTAAIDLLGPAGVADGAAGPEAALWRDRFLFAPGLRIAGGSDEIQRSIIGERRLGLPKEPSAGRETTVGQVLSHAAKRPVGPAEGEVRDDGSG